MSSKPIWRPHLAMLLAATLTLAMNEAAQGQALNLANCVIVATPSTGVAPLTTTFSLGQTMPVLYIEAVGWDFGDGNASPSESPTHTYSSPGTYEVSVGYFFVLQQSISVFGYGHLPEFSTVTRTVVVNPPKPFTSFETASGSFSSTFEAESRNLARRLVTMSMRGASMPRMGTEATWGDGALPGQISR